MQEQQDGQTLFDLRLQEAQLQPTKLRQGIVQGHEVDPADLHSIHGRVAGEKAEKLVQEKIPVFRTSAVAVVTVIIVVTEGIQIFPAFQHALQKLQVRPGRAVRDIAGKDQRIAVFRQFQSLLQTLLLGNAAGFFQKSRRFFL